MWRGWLVVGRRQRSSDQRGDAEHLKKIAGCERAEDRSPIDSAIDIGHLGKHIGEDVRLTTKGIELGARERGELPVGGPWPFNGVHLFHIRNLIDAEQQHIQERERDGHETKAERHGCDDGDRD